MIIIQLVLIITEELDIYEALGDDTRDIDTGQNLTQNASQSAVLIDGVVVWSLASQCYSGSGGWEAGPPDFPNPPRMCTNFRPPSLPQ